MGIFLINGYYLTLRTLNYGNTESHTMILPSSRLRPLEREPWKSKQVTILMHAGQLSKDRLERRLKEMM